MRQFRFHLFSLVLAMLVASGMLWLNIQERRIPFNQMPRIYYGWPCLASIRFDEELLPKWSQDKGSSRITDGETILILDDGKIKYASPARYYAFPVLLNVLTALSFCVLSLGLCEFILRRRDARAKPEASA